LLSNAVSPDPGKAAQMNRFSNPDTVHQPLGKYSHVVGVPGNSEWLVISGQVGCDRDGNVPAGVREQSELAFQNVLACLEANGMGKGDIVKFTVFLTDARFVGDYRAARTKVIGDDVLPASTLLIVAGLATPEMLVEIEALAAKAP
jgi:2-iminobutanoate/2-iminopropanoate deaminase